jgi:hypothetical protein
MIVTRPLPLEAIKGEAGATSKEIKKHGRKSWQQQPEPCFTHHHSQETWDLLPLSKKLVIPTMSTSVQGNMNHSETHWK